MNSCIVSCEGNFLVNDAARRAFYWISPMGEFLSFSTSETYAHLLEMGCLVVQTSHQFAVPGEWQKIADWNENDFSGWKEGLDRNGGSYAFYKNITVYARVKVDGFVELLKVEENSSSSDFPMDSLGRFYTGSCEHYKAWDGQEWIYATAGSYVSRERVVALEQLPNASPMDIWDYVTYNVVDDNDKVLSTLDDWSSRLELLQSLGAVQTSRPNKNIPRNRTYRRRMALVEKAEISHE